MTLIFNYLAKVKKTIIMSKKINITRNFDLLKSCISGENQTLSRSVDALDVLKFAFAIHFKRRFKRRC